MLPLILDCAGQTLTAEEAAFFTQTQPLGFILFARNCANAEQVRGLCGALRRSVGRDDAPIFIDQEGGRVARLKPPNWPGLPALRLIGRLYEADAEMGLRAMFLHTRIIAAMLVNCGVNGNFAPVLDLYLPQASPAIGDRALSADPEIVATLGRVALNTFLAHGVLPVIKHMPGHGRVRVDPHYELPVVETDVETLAAQDFRPFKILNDAPLAMNCHVLFTALDKENPASLSAKIHQDVLRAEIGFKGLIFTDDLAMKALQMPLQERAERAMAAGADIAIFCNGTLAEAKEIASGLKAMGSEKLGVWQKTSALIKAPTMCATEQDIQAGLAELDKLLV